MKKVFILAMVAALGTSPALARGSMEQRSEMDDQSRQQQSMMDQQGQSGGQQALSRDTVRRVQEQLNQQGYQVSVDGVMGPNTRQALQQFQQDKGMQASGQINSDTLAALGVEDQQTQQAQTPEESSRQQQRQQPGMMDQQRQQRGMGSESPYQD